MKRTNVITGLLAVGAVASTAVVLMQPAENDLPARWAAIVASLPIVRGYQLGPLRDYAALQCGCEE